MKKQPRGVLRSLLVVALTLAGVLLVLPAAAGDRGKDDSSVYIVRMVEPAAVAYQGNIGSLEATDPGQGQKIDDADPDVVAYAGYLESRHNAALKKHGAAGKKVYDYRYTYNGFAAELTSGQVKALRDDPGVLTVEKTREVVMDTATTPKFLGLTDPGTGLWNRLGGEGRSGEDVIIGVLDSGAWPESLSFADRFSTQTGWGQGDRVYDRPSHWPRRGVCQSGEEFSTSLCNRKLIGAQYFCEARNCATGVKAHEFVSPRDFNGHGTHTASTAGGNANVPTTGSAAVFGEVNGMAPRARIAAYKVCWDNGAGGCGANTGDAVAAIDKAVEDGVDVINYSISGTQTNYLDAVEVAYLFAADAGVFVATSAGNSGPTASTVAHISPWLAAVAAGTHNRSGQGSVTLGNGTTYNGASLTNGAGPAPFVHASAAGLAGAPADRLRQCFSASANGGTALLDPAKVAGKIVLCERGGSADANARVDKSAAVREAGGAGSVIANVASNSLNADLHTLPTVHVDHVAHPALVSYAATPGATATIAQATVTDTAPAPAVAAFSSRGPSRAGGGDILKPDFMLPGVDVLASVAPPGHDDKDFDVLSGTSMSSPHVAGVAALLTQAHRDWSPAAMRSAMATTAHQSIVGGYNPFGAGSGQVQPNEMVDPGLVYDAGFKDYLGFLKGQGLCVCRSATAIDASDLNQPSIAVGDLAHTQTLSRKVTAVGDFRRGGDDDDDDDDDDDGGSRNSRSTYTASVVAPAGFTVDVSPSTFTIKKGKRQTFTVTITRTDAPLNSFRFGSLTWADEDGHVVRSPIVVRPVAVAAPTELTLGGVSGATSFGIRTGYAGALAYAKRGLIPSQVFSGTVPDDPTDNFNTGNPAGNQGIVAHDIVTPADASLLRISMFDAETDGDDDIDLYLYRVNANSTLTLVGSSGGGTSAEQIQITPAASTTYRLFVHGWQTDGPDANYSFHAWGLGTSDAGNMTVTGPSTATLGGTGTVNLSWAGLLAGKRYLGEIRYMDGATTQGTTIVRIDS